MDTSTLKRLLRTAAKHCPADLQKKISAVLGPQPQESMSLEALRECLIEAADARDFDDVAHYVERIHNLQSTADH